MSKLRFPEIICDKLEDEANGDGYVLAQIIGLPPGWFAASKQRQGQELWDLKFMNPSKKIFRSMMQINEALGGNDYVPDFLRPFNKPALSPLTKEQKEKYHPWLASGGCQKAAEEAAAKKAVHDEAAAKKAAQEAAAAKKSAEEAAAKKAADKAAAKKAAEEAAAKKAAEEAEEERLEEAELARLEEAGGPRDQADGYAIVRREAGQGGSREAFMVLPDDVDCINNLDALAGKIVASGWRLRDAPAPGKARAFTGRWDLTLYADRGRLLVRSQDRGVVDRIARLYTDSWLLA